MNLAAAIRDAFDGYWRQRLFRAVVTGTSGNKVLIQRPGQSSADPQSYARLASYSSPQTNDEVLVAQVGGGYIVVGKVVR